MNARKSVLYLIACLLGSQAEAQDAQAEKPARHPSTEERFEVRNLEGWTVYTHLDTIGKGGGLIIGPTHHVQLDTPLENFWAMVDTIQGAAWHATRCLKPPREG